jgi:fructosamine-3-kinase
VTPPAVGYRSIRTCRQTEQEDIMPPLSERISDSLGIEVTEIRDVGSQHGYHHVTGTLADGRSIFAKVAPAPDDVASDAFAAEAHGLRWLADADGGPPVPQVLSVAADFLAIELLVPLERVAPQAARRFGADLARLHAAGAPTFGAPWPGYIASLPLDNTPSAENADWGTWYAQRRLVPYLKRARDAGAVSRTEVRLVESVINRIGELAGPPEPPSRLHGDLWWANALWSGGRGWLIDPAAHGGHRETDLAMLDLFGAPELDEILQGYTETAPLAEGWLSRVPLHQLHPLLVHVCLFGGRYAAQLATVARAALAAS